jgi:hypothetical protein
MTDTVTPLASTVDEHQEGAVVALQADTAEYNQAE